MTSPASLFLTFANDNGGKIDLCHAQRLIAHNGGLEAAKRDWLRTDEEMRRDAADIAAERAHQAAGGQPRRIG